MQAVAPKPENVIPVSGMAPPPLVVMSLGMQTTLKPKTSENEVCMISCLVHHEFPINKAAPQPPFQTLFCGELLFILQCFISYFLFGYFLHEFHTPFLFC